MQKLCSLFQGILSRLVPIAMSKSYPWLNYTVPEALATQQDLETWLKLHPHEQNITALIYFCIVDHVIQWLVIVVSNGIKLFKTVPHLEDMAAPHAHIANDATRYKPFSSNGIHIINLQKYSKRRKPWLGHRADLL
jgi:hypothetical protein